MIRGSTRSPAHTRRTCAGRSSLVDFWTYTCINWLRTAALRPRAGPRSIKDQGLVVIGVHAPRVRIRKEPRQRSPGRESTCRSIIRSRSTTSMSSGAPSRTNYWPALYFIDAQGRIRHQHFGEGAYEQSEMIIQRLLMRGRRQRHRRRDRVRSRHAVSEAAADWATLKSPENYVGSERTEGFVVARRRGAGTSPARIELPARLRLNEWALSGDWTMKSQAARAEQAQRRASPTAFTPAICTSSWARRQPQRPVRFRVRIDGRPPGAAHGIDVDEQGDGTGDRAAACYQLIRQPEPHRRSPVRDRVPRSGRRGLCASRSADPYAQRLTMEAAHMTDEIVDNQPGSPPFLRHRRVWPSPPPSSARSACGERTRPAKKTAATSSRGPTPRSRR